MLIGKLKVDQVCSYIPTSEQTVNPCAAPSLDGSPFITCATDVATDRWNGNATIELPTTKSRGVRLAGRQPSFGGFVDNLGRKAPLTNVYLNRVGVGLCLNPPPFTLSGDVATKMFPTGGDQSLATINGHIVYATGVTDQWKLAAG